VSDKIKWTAYYRLVAREAWKDAQKNLLSTIVATVSAVLAAYLQYRYYPIPFSSNIPKLVTSFAASLIVLAGYFLFYVLRAPWAVYVHFMESLAAKQGEIDELRRQLEAPSLGVEVLHIELKEERMSNYHSSEFPDGYFGVRIFVELRITNKARVPTTATVTPHIEKNGVSPSFAISLTDGFLFGGALDDALDLQQPIVYGLPRVGRFALVLGGSRKTDLEGSKLRIEVRDGLNAVSTAETSL
jgi:hypothetical protein